MQFVLRFFAVVAAAVCAAYIVKYGALHGLLVLPDSVEYVRIARVLKDLMHGHNLSSVLSIFRFPPGFPLLLTLFLDADVAPQMSALPLFEALAAINAALLVSLCFLSFTRLSTALTCSFAGIVSIAFVHQHLMLYSEPLFFALTLGYLICVLPLGVWQNSFAVSFIRSNCASFAALTRYIGLILPCFAIVSSLTRANIKNRTRATRLFLDFLGLIPLALWIGFSFQAQHTFGGRSAAAHGIAIGDVQDLLAAIGLLFPPLSLIDDSFTRALSTLVIVALIAQRSVKNALGQAVVCSLFLYLTAITAARSFFDAAIPFNDRLLFPALPLVVLTFGIAIEQIRSNVIRTTVLMVVLAASIVQAATTDAAFIKTTRGGGAGFSNPKVSESKLFEYLRTLPKARVLYSNYPDAISLNAGIDAQPVPNRVDPNSGVVNVEVASEALSMVTELQRNSGYVIWFNAFHWRNYQITEENLRTLKLHRTKEFDIASVYAADGNN